jgi:hypothetical protein
MGYLQATGEGTNVHLVDSIEHGKRKKLNGPNCSLASPHNRNGARCIVGHYIAYVGGGSQYPSLTLHIQV